MRKKLLLLFVMSFFAFSNVIKGATVCSNDDNKYNYSANNKYALRYNVTRVGINNSNITFEGWAFILSTNNFRKVDDRGNVTGGQQIRIRAVAGDNVLETITVNGGGDYDFFEEYCWKYNETSNGHVQGQCVTSKKSSTFTCNGEKNSNQDCKYEDIGFSITFDTSRWAIDSNTEISFEISAYNDSHKAKNLEADGTPYNDGWTGWVSLAVDESVISSNYTNGIITAKGSSGCGLFLASSGLLRENDGTKTGLKFVSGLPIGKQWAVYEIAGFDNTKNQIATSKKGSGHYKLNYYTSGSVYPPCGSHAASECNKTSYYVPASWILTTGEFKITVQRDRCDVDNHKDSETLNCNAGNKISSTCNRLAIYGNKNGTSASAVVKIEETGYISNLLTPTSLYNGGGFKFAFTYKNILKWSEVGGSRNCDGNASTCNDIINEAMANRVKTLDAFKNNFKLEDVKFDDETINSNLFNIQCSQSGSFTNGNSLITTCVVSLPDSVLEDYTGEASYYNSGIANIINKYYVPMNFWGTYKIRATFVGLDRLTDNSTVGDSRERGQRWTGTWEMSLSDNQSCNIDVYPLISSRNGYKFVYRPIDVNPLKTFPDRNPGFNWYDWWLGSDKAFNQNRMKTTYDNEKLQYYSILSNERVAEIKTYNKSRNYLYWDDITNGKSEFVTNYAKRVGVN